MSSRRAPPSGSLHSDRYYGGHLQKLHPYENEYSDMYRDFSQPDMGRGHEQENEYRGRSFDHLVIRNPRLPWAYEDVDRYRVGHTDAESRRARVQSVVSERPSRKTKTTSTPSTGDRTEVPFDKVLLHLYRQLVKALDTFNSFKEEYDEEMNHIKSYATKDVMEQLWVLRIKGERYETVEGEDQGDNSLQGSKDNLEFVQSKVNQAFIEIMDAKIDAKWKEERIQAAERLKAKLKTASDQISRLQEMALTRSKHCGTLVGELEELKSLVEPRSDKNAIIFKGGNIDGVLDDAEGGGDNGE